MTQQPHSMLRPTDQHKEILAEAGIRLEPHVDRIIYEWSMTFRKIDPSITLAALNKLKMAYKSFFKTLKQDMDRIEFFEEIAETVNNLPRNGVTFGQLMLSFHLFESSCLPYLKKIYSNKDQLIETLTAMDYACHSCISTLAVAYFNQKSSKMTKLLQLDLPKNKLVENYGLTSREFEVLKRIVDGYKNREIADTLKISIKTVEHHRANLMLKLELRNVADLIKFAVQHRIK
jgi:DNA-binding NarL/FixJ family response regulator